MQHMFAVQDHVPCHLLTYPQMITDPGSIPGLGDFIEKGMATHSSILAWRIPWTEQPGGLRGFAKSQTGLTERLTQQQQHNVLRPGSHLRSVIQWLWSDFGSVTFLL